MASRFHSAGRGETGIRKNWIRFLQDLFVQHPAVARNPTFALRHQSHRPRQDVRHDAGQHTQNKCSIGARLDQAKFQIMAVATKRFNFFGTKSEKGRSRFHSAGPRDVRDGRWSAGARAGWSRLTSRLRTRTQRRCGWSMVGGRFLARGPRDVRDGRWSARAQLGGRGCNAGKR